LRCDDGQGCFLGGDCKSRVCAAMKCAAPTCSDSQQNGDETDLDCGGSCSGKGAGCATGKSCLVAGDCQSGVCDAGKCGAGACTDQLRNGVETDVDCGGGTCPACDVNRVCAVPGDCSSGVCTL